MLTISQSSTIFILTCAMFVMSAMSDFWLCTFIEFLSALHLFILFCNFCHNIIFSFSITTSCFHKKVEIRRRIISSEYTNREEENAENEDEDDEDEDEEEENDEEDDDEDDDDEEKRPSIHLLSVSSKGRGNEHKMLRICVQKVRKSWIPLCPKNNCSREER